MAQSALECANIALTKVGAAQITALADTTETAITCNLCIEPLRKSLLRSHPWNFAIKRSSISPTTVAITGVADNGSGLVRISTASTSGLTNGDRVTIESLSGVTGNGTWVISNLVLNTRFDLVGSVFSGTYVSGGTWTKAPAFFYAFMVSLPTDWIRSLRVNEFTGADYRMEGGKISTDDYPVELKYVYDVTDYTLMDVTFYQLLATGLAAQVCYKITQSSTKEAELRDEFKRMLAKARFDDATEDPAEAFGADDWMASRLSSVNSAFVRDPMT